MAEPSTSKLFRAWVFGSVVWAALVVLYVLVFNPFQRGLWSWHPEEGVARIVFVMAIPWLAGGIKYGYDRLLAAGKSRWRRQSHLFRAWAFGCAVWAALVLLWVLVFEPFGRGQWSYHPGEVVVRILFVMAIPLLAGVVKYGYDRIVK